MRGYYKQSTGDSGFLTQFIELGEIGLYEALHSFVWPKRKVGDLSTRHAAASSSATARSDFRQHPLGKYAKSTANERKSNLSSKGADLNPRFEDRDDLRVLVVERWAANSPVFVKDIGAEYFYVRTGAATTELTPSQTQDFIKKRFG